jgi:hypothetical protein
MLAGSIFPCQRLLECGGSFKLGRTEDWRDMGQVLRVDDGLVSCRNKDLLEPDIKVLVTLPVVVDRIV